MVRLVVDHEDVLETGRFLQHARHHLRRRLYCLRPTFSRRADKHGLRPRRKFKQTLSLECVKVRDDDARGFDERKHVLGDKVPVLVVGLVVVWQQDAQAVLDRDAGRRDEKSVCELGADSVTCGVHRLPGDDHRHHGRLARTGRELEGDAVEVLVRIVVRKGDLLKELLADCGRRRDLRQPDQRLDGLHLTEEWADVRKILLVAPVAEKARRLGRHVPPLLRESAPRIDFLADGVYQVVRPVIDAILVFCKKIGLCHATTSACGGNGRFQAGRTAELVDLRRRLVVLVHVPVPCRVFVGRIENRVVGKRLHEIRRCGLGVVLTSVHPVLFSFSVPVPMRADRRHGKERRRTLLIRVF